MSEIADRSEEETGAPPGIDPSGPDEPVYEPPEDEAPLDPDDLIEDEGDEHLGPREESEEEILVPKVDPVKRVLGDVKGREGNYVQGPFLGFQQMEMYGLLGRATRIVLEGESGMNMDDVFKMFSPKTLVDDFMAHMPGYEDSPDRADTQVGIEDAGRMLAAFSRLIELSPDILKEAYCIILDVPKGQRGWVTEWALPRMPREEMMDVMDTFIDQNWGVLYGFFTEELPRTIKRAAKAHQRFLESAGRRRGH